MGGKPMPDRMVQRWYYRNLQPSSPVPQQWKRTLRSRTEHFQSWYSSVQLFDITSAQHNRRHHNREEKLKGLTLSDVHFPHPRVNMRWVSRTSITAILSLPSIGSTRICLLLSWVRTVCLCLSTRWPLGWCGPGFGWLAGTTTGCAEILRRWSGVDGVLTTRWRGGRSCGQYWCRTVMTEPWLDYGLSRLRTWIAWIGMKFSVMWRNVWMTGVMMTAMMVAILKVCRIGRRCGLSATRHGIVGGTAVTIIIYLWCVIICWIGSGSGCCLGSSARLTVARGKRIDELIWAHLLSGLIREVILSDIPIPRNFWWIMADLLSRKPPAHF